MTASEALGDATERVAAGTLGLVPDAVEVVESSVRSLRALGVSVDLPREEHLPGERVCTITGTLAQVHCAQRLVSQQLATVAAGGGEEQRERGGEHLRERAVEVEAPADGRRLERVAEPLGQRVDEQVLERAHFNLFYNLQ